MPIAGRSDTEYLNASTACSYGLTPVTRIDAIYREVKARQHQLRRGRFKIDRLHRNPRMAGARVKKTSSPARPRRRE